MKLNHVALYCTSEEKTDLFYGTILGLEKKSVKEVPKTLSTQIFDLDNEFKIVNYGNDAMTVEVFIGDTLPSLEKNVNHICLEVKSRELFLKKCSENNVNIRRIPKGEYVLIFIEDFNGNMFEIKEMM